MTTHLLVRNIWVQLSIINAVLVTITSLLGIFNPVTYKQETANWATQAIGQDIANLAVVPLLLISTYFTAKGSGRAYLVWLGVFIYLVYAFVIYSFSVHFNYLFLVYIAVLSLSIFTPIGSIIEGATSSLSKNISPKIEIKLPSILLMAIGILFSLLWLSEIIPQLFSGMRSKSLIETGLWTNPVHVLDLGLLLPSMIITSIALWKRKLLGYVLTVPLLVFSATMGIGIIILFGLLAINEGGPVATPAYVIGLIVILSTYFSYRFLKKMNS